MKTNELNQVLFDLKGIRDDFNEKIIELENLIEEQIEKEREKTFIEKQSFSFEDLKNMDQMAELSEEEYYYQITLVLFHDQTFENRSFTLFKNKYFLFNEISTLMNAKSVLKFVTFESLINSFRNFFDHMAFGLNTKDYPEELKNELLHFLFVIFKRMVSILLSYDKRHTHLNMKEILPLENISMFSENLKTCSSPDLIKEGLDVILNKMNYLSEHCGWKVPYVAL